MTDRPGERPSEPALGTIPGRVHEGTEPPSSATRRVKRRQMLLLAGIASLIGIGTVVLVSLTSPKTSQDPATKPKSFSILAPGAQVDPKDAWRGQADAQLKAIEQRSRELKQRETEMQGQAREMLERLEKLESGEAKGRANRGEPSGLSGLTPLPPPPVPAPALRPNFGPDPVVPQQAIPTAQAAQNSLQRLPPPPGAPYVPPGSSGGNPSVNPAAGPGSRGTTATPPSGIFSITFGETPSNRSGNSGSTHKANTGTETGAPAPDRQAPVRDTRRYLPSGSFTRAVLLGGLDAPTGGQSQRNPQPVLLRLVDHAVLPNAFRGQVKECFVVGAGYGDVSAERAYIRTESLSCVTRSGAAIDVPVKGYVAGEDGKAGMRGRLVSKQGQILANALLAGVASGIGTAFQQSASTVSVSPLGTTGTVDPGKQLQAGLGTGVGKALDRLAQYYITLAEKVFPVIEIDAGRTVDVVLTQGITLDAALDTPAQDGADALARRRIQLNRKADDEDED